MAADLPSSGYFPDSQSSPPPSSSQEQSDAPPQHGFQGSPPIDPNLREYDNRVDDSLSDLTSLNSAQIDDLFVPGSTNTQYTITPSPFGFLEPRAKVRRSWIWKHGTSTTVHNRTFWKCSLCPPRHAKQYADSSTKHQIEHLRTHRLTEHGLIPTQAAGSEAPSIIRQAFGNSHPRIHFNIDLFKDLLLQWMILSNISFAQVLSCPLCLNIEVIQV